MSYYQTDYYDGRNPQSLDAKVSAVMKSVYIKMFLALLVTAATAWIAAAWGTEANVAFFIATHSWVYWGLAIVELGLVIFITSRLNKLSPAMSTGLFYLFAIVNGLTLSIIFLAFSFASIFKTFVITAGVFGAMSVYGYFTNRDLTKIGSFLYMALFGLIILCVVNMFWANSTLDWIVSGLGVLIFIGLTAWDTQKIKQMTQQYPAMADGRLATWGALSLYLDFINLFLYLLRFFGSSRD
ncbi:MAG: Bax inhibitor-1/YccA family protein [Muribaculaceae bacterium]|nr:Bax inhibitor-1/YccA family protein [Muribaculaceae bacterium]